MVNPPISHFYQAEFPPLLCSYMHLMLAETATCATCPMPIMHNCICWIQIVTNAGAAYNMHMCRIPHHLHMLRKQLLLECIFYCLCSSWLHAGYHAHVGQVYLWRLICKIFIFIFAESANIKVLSTCYAASTIQWIAHRQKNFPLAPFVGQKSGTNAMGSDLLDVYTQIQSGSTNVPPISV